jgi:blue copper oxidase
LLKRPVSRSYVFLAPGERIELWSDFSDSPVGYETALMSLSFDGGRMGRGMMMGGSRGNNQILSNGAKVSLFKFKVTKSVAIRKSLPQKLSEVIAVQEHEADNYGHRALNGDIRMKIGLPVRISNILLLTNTL